MEVQQGNFVSQTWWRSSRRGCRRTRCAPRSARRCLSISSTASAGLRLLARAAERRARAAQAGGVFRGRKLVRVRRRRRGRGSGAVKLAIAGAGGPDGRHADRTPCSPTASCRSRWRSMCRAARRSARSCGGREGGLGPRAALGHPEVLIDFTRPERPPSHLEACVTHAKADRYRTTDSPEIQKKSMPRRRARRIPVVMSHQFRRRRGTCCSGWRRPPPGRSARTTTSRSSEAHIATGGCALPVPP